MPEQEKDQTQQSQPTQAELYGDQGNQGQYGQGQYDMDGKPDPNGAQAQRSAPDDQKQQPKQTGQADRAYQSRPAANGESHKNVPED